MSNGMFKVNDNNINISAYMLDSYSLQYYRIGHAHARKLGEAVNLNLIPKYAKDLINKYKICMQLKWQKNPFSRVGKTSFIL